MLRKVVTSPQQALLNGVNTLADAVGSTLGPLGRNVIIETPYGATTVTKDGVTVADLIHLEEPVENLGAQIIKQAAKRTATQAGDGTTTATILAQALIQEAYRLVSSGIAPIKIKKDFESYLATIIPLIDEQALEVSSKEDVYQIALISSNSDPLIASLIAQAIEYVGKDGSITVEDSSTDTSSVELVDGVTFDRGFASPYLINDVPKAQSVLENPVVFITDRRLRSQEEILPLMELVASLSRPLLLIADDVEGQALQTLVINKLRGAFQVNIVRAPSYGDNRLEVLKDLAALTSATFMSEASGRIPQSVTSSDLGEAAKVISTSSQTIIVDGSKDEDAVQTRADHIRKALETYTPDSYYYKQLKHRLSQLTAKVAVLRVGASTETELKEKKDRIDDALRATTCALSKGYTVGGGTLLAKLSSRFDSSLTASAFATALTAPLRKIASNAGTSPELVLSRVIENPDIRFGFNAATSSYTDLITDGVIDPILVIRQALLNAVSAANMLIISSTAIYAVDRTPPYSPGNLEDYAPQ